MTSSIGRQLFESDSAEPEKAIEAPTASATGRSFRFESSGVVAGGDFKQKLKLGGGAMIAIAVFAAVLWMSVREKNGETQKPILPANETASNIKSYSHGAVETTATPTSADSSTTSTPKTEIVESPDGDQVAKEETQTTLATASNEIVEIAEAKVDPFITPRKVSKAQPKLVQHTQTPLLVKWIDEKQVMVESDNTDYIVKRGQYLPDGTTVFIGFDKAESIMRTSAGDFRIGS